MTNDVALNNPYSLGATGIVTLARTDRLSLGASFRPSTSALGAVSGFLYGPPGTMGDLTLLTDTLLRVDPFLAVIQGTHASDQGQYLVPNAAQRDLAVPAKDASLFRRALVVVRVADSIEAGVASSATTDGAWLEIIPGPLAASNPALPSMALFANYLLAGELSIPSTASGQPVTITKYAPRTTTRGGTLPVLVDGATISGHDGAPGSYVGQPRDHPTNGLERWDGNRWGSVAPLGQWVDDVYSQTYGFTVAGYQNPPSMGGRLLIVPPGRTFELECVIGQANIGSGANMCMELYQNSIRQDGFSFQYPGPGTFTGQVRLRGMWVNTTNAPINCPYSITCVVSPGAASLNAGAYGVVRLSRRIL